MDERHTDHGTTVSREFGDWLVIVDLVTGDFTTAVLGPKPNRRHRRAAEAWVHRTLNDSGFETSRNEIWLMFND